MGFVKRWGVEEIQQQLRACQAQVASPYNDGFTAWACKQDLLQIKYELDEFLKTAPKFAGEEEYIQELEKKIVWKTLTRQ
jgi:hypothetical protein